jgi:hypothetical protein
MVNLRQAAKPTGAIGFHAEPATDTIESLAFRPVLARKNLTGSLVRARIMAISG